MIGGRVARCTYVPMVDVLSVEWWVCCQLSGGCAVR